MTTPAFLSSPFYFHGVSGYFDVSQILQDLATLLPAAGWTVVAPDRFRSPATAGGRLMECAFSRVNAGLLTMSAYGVLGNRIGSRGMGISTTGVGSAIRCFYGSNHLYLDCETTADYLGATIIDPSPMREDVGLLSSAMMHGSRNTSGDPGYNAWSYWGLWNFGATGSVYTNTGWAHPGTTGNLTCRLQNANMDYMFWPLEYVGDSTVPALGRAFQMLLGPSLIPRYQNIQAPIGGGETGVFMRGSANPDNACLLLRVS